MMNPTLPVSSGNRSRLRKREEADRLSISVRCLENWMAQGLVPYTRIGNVVLFDPVETDAALGRFKRGVTPRGH